MNVCKKCSYKSYLAASKSFIRISETYADLNLNWLESLRYVIILKFFRSSNLYKKYLPSVSFLAKLFHFPLDSLLPHPLKSRTK